MKIGVAIEYRLMESSQRAGRQVAAAYNGGELAKVLYASPLTRRQRVVEHNATAGDAGRSARVAADWHRFGAATMEVRMLQT